METRSDCSSILKDVVAYVDVWSSNKTENYSKPFIQQLNEMGAQVSKTFNKQVTHVVFNNGHQATWKKAKKTGVKLVSVLWVASCKDDGVHMDEELYPALNDERYPELKKRTHRCMQPRDSPDKTPENDRRMKKKLDKMIKDLPPKTSIITDVSPYIIDEENGIVYSPKLKRSDSMALRLKEMKEKRENLSPTASQMVEPCSSPGLKPSLGSTPTICRLLYEQSDDDDATASFAGQTDCSSDKEEERTQLNDNDHFHLKRRQRKDSEKPWLSPCKDVSQQKSVSPLKFPVLDDKEKKTKQKNPRRTSVKKLPPEKHNSSGTLEIPEGSKNLDKNDTDHCHLQPCHKKDSEKPSLSSCKDVSEQKSVTPLKIPDVDDKEKGIKRKNSRRSSIKKQPLEKHNSVRSRESPADSKNLVKIDIDDCHLEPCHRKDSVTLLKLSDSGDKEKGTKKNSRSTSIKKQPREKHNSVGSIESPEDFLRNKNCHKKREQSQSKSHSPAVEKSEQSPDNFEKGKQKTRAVQSLTEGKTQSCPKALNSPTCFSPPTILGSAIVDQELVKGITSSFPKVDQKIPKRARPSFSALVKSFAMPNESQSVASSSIDEDDNVFEDYFSPANHRRKQRPLLPSLPLETQIQIPFELDSSTGRRKQRKGETTGAETICRKKRKRNSSYQSDSLNNEPQNHQHQDFQESPPAMDSDDKNVVPVTSKRSRRRTLPLMSNSEFTADPVNQRKTSVPAQLPKSSLEEASAEFGLQKNSDVNVLSHTIESGGSALTAAAGLTETLSEGIQNQVKEVSLTFKKMDTKTKNGRTLVMTSMSTEKQHTVAQVVKTLGGFSIEDRVCESTTHVVSGGHRRTLNILLGIARGCWILSYEWILWCLEQRQWIPEEPYELSDYFPAAPICRLQQHLSAGEHQQDLFQGQPAMFVSQHSQPPTQSLVELIQLCGGTVCKTVRQAGICIGRYNGRRPEGSRMLSEQWVLDCITHLKQLSYDIYDLE